VITAENSLLISKLSLLTLQLDKFSGFDVVDDTEAKDENSILLRTPELL
jgi:outer membrane protein